MTPEQEERKLALEIAAYAEKWGYIDTTSLLSDEEREIDIIIKACRAFGQSEVYCEFKWMKRARDAEASLAVVRQSLKEQAEARADPTMPRLKPTVLASLEGLVEAMYASASTKEERMEAHALDLLCKWQRNVRD